MKRWPLLLAIAAGCSSPSTGPVGPPAPVSHLTIDSAAKVISLTDGASRYCALAGPGVALTLSFADVGKNWLGVISLNHPRGTFPWSGTYVAFDSANSDQADLWTGYTPPTYLTVGGSVTVDSASADSSLYATVDLAFGRNAEVGVAGTDSVHLGGTLAMQPALTCP